MILGTFAFCGSGQDTLADSMCKLFGYKKYSVGDIIKEIANDKGIPKTRSNLRRIRKQYDQDYGRNYFPKKLIQQIQSDNFENVIITGIRTIQEYRLFKKTFHIKLIYVYADEEIRYQRMLKRQSDKDEIDIRMLYKQMEVEEKMFDYGELKKVFDVYFNFNMSLEEYLENENEIVNTLLLTVCDKEG